MTRVDALALWVAARRIATDPRAIWRWSVRQLRAAIEGDPPLPTNRHGRWEPFAASVLLDDGALATASAVTEGIGAGRVHALGRPGSGNPGPRSILAVGTPLPQIAPLLWQCAALVTARGTEGAHLFEVASSLGVPAVIGVDLRRSHGEPAAVDGARGLVATSSVALAPVVGRIG
jgi:phosphohistidine swiveling domain-containing protein